MKAGGALGLWARSHCLSSSIRSFPPRCTVVVTAGRSSCSLLPLCDRNRSDFDFRNRVWYSSSQSAGEKPAAPVLLETDSDGVATLTLNNPRERNALSLAVLQELSTKLEAIDKDSAVRVVILKAEGPVFSSGHNLKELKGKDKAYYDNIFHLCSKVMEQVRLLPRPVIAQVDGLATAAGAQLVAGCDLVLASKKSAFATPGVKIGLFCSTPAVAVGRAITSTKKTMEMLLTGDPITADEAYTFGLVNKVLENTEELEKKTREMAKKIASYSPAVIALGKKGFHEQIGEKNRDTAYALAEKVMSSNACIFDAQEGMSAFLEKRNPNWKKE